MIGSNRPLSSWKNASCEASPSSSQPSVSHNANEARRSGRCHRIAFAQLKIASEHAQPKLLAASTAQEPTTASGPALSEWQGPIQPYIVQPSGVAQVVFRIPTTQPVIFIGIDDGWIKTPQNLQWLTSHHLPFSLFLTNNGIKDNYGYFKQLQDAGMDIEDHTLSHGDLTKMTAAQQQNEICHAADIYQSVYGRRPTLFRPPYGA